MRFEQQQVKVVIRLKPFEAEPLNYRCVYLSEQQNHLVVETGNKKEIFVFDHVASETASQRDVYRMIGEEAVERSLQGYNCCVFAYGQTGAGKTYSVIGDVGQLQNDYYCESRGLIPRILEDIFNCSESGQQRRTVSCSYIQIYNEQILDLFSLDKRIHQLREDKRGVFVQGLDERRLSSYREGMEAILQGERTKTIAATSMNAQSSRSHVIFTISIHSQRVENEKVTVRKSKLHIVDLAGSERTKHTLVEGERLKQGCNINKSLHVLGNVINSLVESAKKKKHIPFRDSKLTHLLKDSLGGNSITKLLANVHCGKRFYGDTLSTLMFAKRAKILKIKVQVNEKQMENFDHLRQEVKKLREELAETRYFKQSKNKSQGSSEQDYELAYERITDHTEFQVQQKDQVLLSLQRNQLHYKALIEIYEQHTRTCGNKQKPNIVREWKNMENRNKALTGLLKNIPAFTTIYKENLLLKKDKNKEINRTVPFDQVIHTRDRSQTTRLTLNYSNKEPCFEVTDIIEFYEKLIEETAVKFRECLQKLQRSYVQLQKVCKVKDLKIKEMINKEGSAPEIEELKNENEYLQLNVLNLEDELVKLQESQTELERRHSRRSRKRSSIQDSSRVTIQAEETQEDYSFVLQKLMEIKSEALRQAQIAEKERAEMERTLAVVQSQLNFCLEQNRKLKVKYERSRSQRKSSQRDSRSHLGESGAKKSAKELSVPAAANVVYYDSEARSVNSSLVREGLAMKMLVKRQQKQIVDLQQQVTAFMSCDRRIEQQFGKDVEEIILEYRQMVGKARLGVCGSYGDIGKWGEETLVRTPKVDSNLLQKIEMKLSMELGRGRTKDQSVKVKSKLRNGESGKGKISSFQFSNK